MRVLCSAVATKELGFMTVAILKMLVFTAVVSLITSLTNTLKCSCT